MPDEKQMHPNSLANLTPWKKGQSGNPGGISKAQKRLTMENAERASHVRNMLLQALEAAVLEVAAAGKAEEIIELAQSPVMTLLRDSEERGLGKPVQPIEDGTAPKTDEELEQEAGDLMRGMGVDEATIKKLLAGRSTGDG